MHRRNAQNAQSEIYARRVNPARPYARSVTGKTLLLCVVLFSLPMSCFVGSLIWPSDTDHDLPVTLAQISSGPQVVAYRPAVDDDVIIVSGEGFAPGEHVAVVAIPANADFARQPPWPTMAPANADSTGHISVVLNHEKLRSSPYAQVRFWVRTQTGQFAAADTFDLSHVTGSEGDQPITVASRPEPAATATPNPQWWTLEGFSQPTLTDALFPAISVQSVTCQRKSPVLSPKVASARWVRQLNIPKFSNIVFTLTALGGARLYIDDQPVPLIDEWHQSDQPHIYKAHIHLTKGMHRLRMDYFKSRRGCKINLQWAEDYPNWRAEVYDNENLDGPVIASVALDSIAKDNPARVKDTNLDLRVVWDDYTIAEVKPDHFSVNITRTLFFKETRTYQITLNTPDPADQARLYINQKPVFGEWASNPRVILYEFKANVRYPLQLQFRDIDGRASVELTFAWVSPTPVPILEPVP